ncbi:hypothetical protein NQ314_012769 [Rhamnusium bicolor]|uniref:NADH dehydrogenase [ubiquinone] 1 beta subcomplex subunit 4 n=1 Tax=Rhamnusium bicolor TaxID=1586634 RepID=A0AAV8XA32_9CUCU|nr:hypothetical protein NQ314_012769 [Rhamnusium bicolor]
MSKCLANLMWIAKLAKHSKKRQKRRAFLRDEFLKLKSDPFQHASGEGGTVFDPAIQRYQAMKVSGFEYFKPSGKNIIHGLLLVVLPMTVFGYLLNRSRTNLEAKYRRGEVAYKDRGFKFI